MSHFSIKTNEKPSIDLLPRVNFMVQRRDAATHSIQNEVSANSTQPVWDRDARELRVGNVVVKHFKWPAENQEQILNAFEDNGWPPRIKNPLAHHPTICPKRRLHDTIKCLNRKQLKGLIKFRGDGTGRGVLLEFNLQD
jgi:hypothetical protein